MKDERSPQFLKWIMRKRDLVKIVISQLEDKCNITKVWARNMWHLSRKIRRKLMSHTMTVMANFETSGEFLTIDKVVR